MFIGFTKKSDIDTQPLGINYSVRKPMLELGKELEWGAKV